MVRIKPKKKTEDNNNNNNNNNKKNKNKNSSSKGITSSLTGSFDIYIKTLTGKSITITTSASETIQRIKTEIEEKEGIAVAQQSLIFDRKCCMYMY